MVSNSPDSALPQSPKPRPYPASLEVGSKVWIYDGQAPPREGTITASGYRIAAGAWYARDTFGERLYSRHSLFTDPEKLIAEVRDTVDLLERWGRDFRHNDTAHTQKDRVRRSDNTENK